MTAIDQALVLFESHPDDHSIQSQFYDLFLNATFFVPVLDDQEGVEEGEVAPLDVFRSELQVRRSEPPLILARNGLDTNLNSLRLLVGLEPSVTIRVPEEAIVYATGEIDMEEARENVAHLLGGQKIQAGEFSRRCRDGSGLQRRCRKSI